MYIDNEKNWRYCTGRYSIELWKDSNHYIFKHNNKLVLLSIPIDSCYSFDVNILSEYLDIRISNTSDFPISVETEGIFKNKVVVLDSNYKWEIKELIHNDLANYKLVFTKKST